MRDLTRLHCEALVTREFWLGDRLVCPACYAFLSLNNGEALGWWFDDDPGIWRLETVDVVGLPGTEEGWIDDDGRTWRYPNVDLTSRFGVRGGELSRWTAEEIGLTAQARLIFADGTSVVFAYDFRSESYRISREVGIG